MWYYSDNDFSKKKDRGLTLHNFSEEKMKKTLITQITECIERTFDINGKDMSRNIIVFPCGDVGIQVVNILKTIYSIEPAYLIDNKKCKYNSNISDSSFLKEVDAEKYVLILASTNPDIYITLREIVSAKFPEEHILELEKMKERMLSNPLSGFKTKIGRYSYGSICRDHSLIESIGSFCSFANGVEVVPNHEMNYVTTHPIIYMGACYDGIEIKYEDFKKRPWYMPGVKPKSIVTKLGRTVIGNDVWLGQNVIITNYANIGNGVVAAAGAVITKDVPDYAVVAGVPARIIRYRYTPAQIEALNKIAWWNWTDDEIRERFDDFYLPIEEFIEKYR